MEIASSGFKTKLTSRGYKPSFNVPENRYILFTAYRLHNLLSNLGKVSSYVSTSLIEKVKTQEDRLLNFKDSIIIDKRAVMSEYKELKEAVDHEQEMIGSALQAQQLYLNSPSSNERNVSYVLKLGTQLTQQHYSESISFFLYEGLKPLQKPDYYRIEFEKCFSDILKTNTRYRIEGKILYETNTWNNKTAHRIIFRKIDKLEIINKVKLIDSFWKEKFKKKVKIGVTGLNPHCESIDSFNEDKKIILPTIKKLKKLKYNIEGPLAADTIFLKNNRKKFDVIIGMYHDQVLTPIKTLFEYDAINA